MYRKNGIGIMGSIALILMVIVAIIGGVYYYVWFYHPRFETVNVGVKIIAENVDRVWLSQVTEGFAEEYVEVGLSQVSDAPDWKEGISVRNYTSEGWIWVKVEYDGKDAFRSFEIPRHSLAEENVGIEYCKIMIHTWIQTNTGRLMLEVDSVQLK